MCLVCRVLKNVYFKEHLSMIASKYSICVMKIIFRNLNYIQCLNIAPMEKALLMTPIEYSPNGKDIIL